jgi:hypothetical protein
VRGTGCILRFERRFQRPLFGDERDEEVEA